jgi:hypothetical protein
MFLSGEPNATGQLSAKENFLETAPAPAGSRGMSANVEETTGNLGDEEPNAAFDLALWLCVSLGALLVVLMALAAKMHLDKRGLAPEESPEFYRVLQRNSGPSGAMA